MKPSPLSALLLGLAACAPDHVVQGRPYTLTVPSMADAVTPLPLVVLVHGYGVNGLGQDLVFPFSKAVNAKSFLYALPDGTVDRLGKRFWNATDACCDFGAVPVDDVAFLRAVIEDVKAQHPVDPTRVFLIGHSNGGYMALRMACDASDVITGVVSVAGAAWLDASRCPAGAPVSVLQIHGTRDTFVAYEGSTSTSGTPYPGAVGTTDRFAARNGCSGTKTAADPLDLLGPADAETRRDVYDGCPKTGAVELWTIDGAGHLPTFNAAWPGRVIDWLLERPR